MTDALSMGLSGVQETAATTSTAFVIPNDDGGGRAKKVAIRVITASETMYVRPVIGVAGAVTAENGLPVAKETPVILDVAGYTHIAALRAGTTDVVFNITPING